MQYFILSFVSLCMQAGHIVDDELNRLLVNPLAPGVRLHAIIDACHSGTALDLEFRCKVKSSGITWKNEYTHRPSVYKVRLHADAACCSVYWHMQRTWLSEQVLHMNDPSQTWHAYSC